MLAEADDLRSTGPYAEALSFSHGDARTARIGRTFDAALSLFHVVSYQITNADVLAEFITARHHLDGGGIFIFDVWYGPTVLTCRPSVRVKRMENESLAITRLAEPEIHPDSNVVDVNYTVMVQDKATGNVQEVREKHPMRYFFTPELKLLAAQTEFEVLHSEEWLTGRQPGFDTWGVVFILRAI
jgi:hypothetical protein